VLQCSLLIAFFSIATNSVTDTYLLSQPQITPKVILQLNHIVNQTHNKGWLGPTLLVETNFQIIPVSTGIGIVLTIGLLFQTWSYRMTTKTDMDMESYSPETLADHVQWDNLFSAYLLFEHALFLVMLCSPSSFTFIVLMTLLLTIAIIERCSPRHENRRDDSSQTLSTISLMAALFVALQVVTATRRHVHSSGIFFILHTLLDMLLILGHTWDSTTHQFATALNCRSFFVSMSTTIVFSMFVTHCSHLTGRDAVTSFVSDIYE
jgi:hypothetical protein